MTTRLYYTDAYLRSFSSPVVGVSSDGTRVYLERTAFYPTSGGQPFDIGTLAGAEVVDVVDEGERVAHVLASPAGHALRPGAVVEGRIRWERRFDHMQQHTGQHLLSAVLHERYGWATVSVHFGTESSTLDLDVTDIPPEQVAEAEREANAVVFENRPIGVTFEDAASASGLRKASDREGELRIVTIEGLDRAACGGTHVRATGEIGAILIRKVERVRRAVRLEFLCGQRAVRQARADFLALSRIAQSFSTSLENAPALVEAQLEEARTAAGEIKRLRQDLAELRAQALLDAVEPDAAGVRWIVEPDPVRGAEETRALAHAVSTEPLAVLAAALPDPPAVLLAASADSGVDAGRALREALAAAGGRGGGSPRVAQGSVPDAATAAAVVRALARAAADPGRLTVS